jgi:hypothetical protein
MKTIKKTIYTNSIPRDLLASKFIEVYREDIMKFALCHTDKEGYVSVSVTKEYTLGPMRFIGGIIDWSKFSVFLSTGDGNPWPGSEMDERYFLYEIHFPEINTWYRNGELYFEVKKIISNVYNPQ